MVLEQVIAPQQMVNLMVEFLPDNYVYKLWNYFYNPMINQRINDSGEAGAAELQGEGFQSWSKNLSWQIHLNNSRKYPEFERQSLAETFYYLRRAIHYMNPDQNSLSFSYRQYRETNSSLVCHLKRWQTLILLVIILKCQA